jgi:hypothetical protein
VRRPEKTAGVGWPCGRIASFFLDFWFLCIKTKEQIKKTPNFRQGYNQKNITIIIWELISLWCHSYCLQHNCQFRCRILFNNYILYNYFFKPVHSYFYSIRPHLHVSRPFSFLVRCIFITGFYYFKFRLCYRFIIAFVRNC